MPMKNSLFFVKFGILLTLVFLFVVCFSFSVKADAFLSSLEDVSITMSNGATTRYSDCRTDEFCLIQVGDRVYLTDSHTVPANPLLLSTSEVFTSLTIVSSSSRYTSFFVEVVEWNYSYEFDLDGHSFISSFSSPSLIFVSQDDMEIVVNSASGIYIYFIDNDAAETSLTYEDGYWDGRSDGIDIGSSLYFTDVYDGYSPDGVLRPDGVDDGAFDSGYIEGHTQGIIDSGDNVAELLDFVPAVLGIIIAFFFQLSSISALGISALDILGTLFAISLVLFAFKVFLSK